MFLSDPNLYGVTHPYKEIPTPLAMGAFPQFVPQFPTLTPQFFGPTQGAVNPWIRPEQIQAPFFTPTMFQNPLVREQFHNPFIAPTMLHNPLVRPEPFHNPYLTPTMFQSPFVRPEPIQTPFGLTPNLPYGYQTPFLGWNRPWAF